MGAGNPRPPPNRRRTVPTIRSERTQQPQSRLALIIPRIQEVNTAGKRVLCRTENYTNSHAGFDALLRGRRILSALEQLGGEEMVLFKEKINYKFAGSGGFDPHIDANAYTHVKNIKHLTVLVAVDEMSAANGGLEVVDGSHCMTVPLGGDRCIEPGWVDDHVWSPCNLGPGMCCLPTCYRNGFR